MTRINNDEITRKIVEDTKISVSEGVPNEMSNIIAPVLIVNPERRITIIRNQTGSGNLFTTSTTKETYMTGYAITMCSFEQGAVASASLTVTLSDGSSQVVGDVKTRTDGGATSSQMSQSVAHSFKYPIKLKKGTNVASTMGGSGGRVIFYGYEVDSINRK